MFPVAIPSIEMASSAAEPSPPVGVTAGDIESQQIGGERNGENNGWQNGEQRRTAHMQGWALASLTFAFMAICFVLALDNTILGLQTHSPWPRWISYTLTQYRQLATAIPQITSDFQSLNDIGWYGSSYLIAQMALLPTCGRLYAFYNIKWVYCVSLMVFEVGSVVSAVAPNSMALIIGRAVSGMGAAGLVSGTTTILSYCVPLKKQAKLSPIILGLYSTGSAIGPLVGGSITDSKTLTWRFIFWLNLRKWFRLASSPVIDTT